MIKFLVSSRVTFPKGECGHGVLELANQVGRRGRGFEALDACVGIRFRGTGRHDPCQGRRSRHCGLIATGLDRSASFRDLVAGIERTNWVVFVMRGRCPTSEIVAGLLHTVARVDGQPYVRVVIDNRQFTSPQVEIGSVAHELQHALEAAESDDVVDSVSLDARFRRIGYISLQTRTTTTYETEAARGVGARVLGELEYSPHQKASQP